MELFTEVFPIRTTMIQSLTAYRVVATVPKRGAAAAETIAREIGGTVAYRLRGKLPGAWAWVDGRVLTDNPPSDEALSASVEALRKDKGAPIKPLASLERDSRWRLTAEHAATFITYALLPDLEARLREALHQARYDLHEMRVERFSRVEAWEVDGQPALSLSITTGVFRQQPLADYLNAKEAPPDPVGLHVRDATSDLTGEVVRVVGKLADHRARLLGLTQRDVMRAALEQAPDETPILRLRSRTGREYDYPASALEIAMQGGDADRFKADARQLDRARLIRPAFRAHVVRLVADVLKSEGVIDNAYSTQNSASRFSIVPFHAELAFGGGRPRETDLDNAPHHVQQLGVYSNRTGAEARIAVLNALGDEGDDLVEAMRRVLEQQYAVTLTIVKTRAPRTVSTSTIESAVRALVKEKAAALLALIPNDPDGTDDDGGYPALVRRESIGRGVPCLVISAAMMQRSERMPHWVTALLARTGDQPYVFESPLAYTDRVVGLSATMRQKKSGAAITAFARLYAADGAFLRWTAGETTLDADGNVPDDFMPSLLPEAYIGRKRVLLHHLTPMHGGQTLESALLRAVGAWEDECDASIAAISVRRGAPRLYALDNRIVTVPPLGAMFRLSEREAFFVATAPRRETPIPLHITTESAITIEQAVESLVRFTLLHYGSTYTPRLPVTLSGDRDLLSAIERDVFPTPYEGDRAFWL